VIIFQSILNAYDNLVTQTGLKEDPVAGTCEHGKEKCQVP